MKPVPVYEYQTPRGRRPTHSFIERDGRRLMGHALVPDETKVFGGGIYLYRDGGYPDHFTFWSASDVYRIALTQGHERIGWRPFDTGAKVELHPAFYWTCKVCDKGNFIHVGFGGAAPSEVKCQHCEATFRIG